MNCKGYAKFVGYALGDQLVQFVLRIEAACRHEPEYDYVGLDDYKAHFFEVCLRCLILQLQLAGNIRP